MCFSITRINPLSTAENGIVLCLLFYKNAQLAYIALIAIVRYFSNYILTFECQFANNSQSLMFVTLSPKCPLPRQNDASSKCSTPFPRNPAASDGTVLALLCAAWQWILPVYRLQTSTTDTIIIARCKTQSASISHC